MNWWLFILNSLLLGVGLTMDAFSVSLVDGFNEPNMKSGKVIGIASTFGIYQMAMPLIGWVLVVTVAQFFNQFLYFVPWIALGLLGFIGGKMIVEFIKERIEEKKAKENDEEVVREEKKLTFGALMLQGIATAIDALSVGFTMNETAPTLNEWYIAVICGAIILTVTVIFCIVGLIIGKKVGTKISKFAGLVGGIILVGLGIEIFISNMIDLNWMMPWQAFMS